MRLIVVTQDRLSDWEDKGEIVYGYFNPANVFDFVDIVLLNNDQPKFELLKILCGGVPFQVYNLPLLTHSVLIKTLGWQSRLLNRHYKQIIKLLQSNRRTVVRAYETDLASYSAYIIAKELECEYAVSLHSTPDKNSIRLYSSLKDRFVRFLTRRLGQLGLENATSIIAVYHSIIEALPPSLQRKSIVIPNAVGVNPDNIKKKYLVEGSLNLVTIGRLVHGKSPAKIIEGLAQTRNAYLTVIGDGPLRDELITQAKKLGLKDRITFIKRMDNEKLCAELHKFDGFVFRTDYNECPKTVIEAALVGLPIICPEALQNRVLELEEMPLIACNDSPIGFANALINLKEENKREQLGKTIAIAAQKQWAPLECAGKSASLLVSLLK